MANDMQRNAGFLNKKITLKWAVLLLALAILAGLTLWILRTLECRRIAQECDSTLREQATRTAEVVARSIATFGNRQIVQQDWGALQDAADELISQRPLSYIAVTNREGVAVVHTDRSLRGRQLREPEETEQVVEASVPAMSATEQAGTVRVGVNVGQR